MARRLLFVLPAVAAAIVLWAVLYAGVSEPVLAVQIFGGPSGSAPRSLLITALRTDGSRGVLVPDLPLRLGARAGGANAVWTGSTDATGHAEVALEWSGSATALPEVTVIATETGVVLGQGTLDLSTERWLRGARQQGGWLTGLVQGELELRVAPLEGALAVPFETQLLVEITKQAAAPLGEVARLIAELDGAALTLPASSEALSSDLAGKARLSLRPEAHAVSLRLRAETPSGARGEWFGALPVVPGALHAELGTGRLRVRSPIERSHAYVSLITRTERLGGAILALQAEPHGDFEAELSLEPPLLERLRAEPSWAVVSSEFDKRSPAVVGWPIGAAARDLPPHTLDVPDQLLLDAAPAALALDRELKLGRRRLAAGLLLGVGVLMTVLLWREVQKRPSDALSDALSGPDGAALGQSGGWVLWVALGLILLAVLALTYFSLMRR